MTLEDIGEGDSALLCATNFTGCCRPPNTGNGSSFGNWFLPNATRVPSQRGQWDFYRSRGEMVVKLNRRRGGEEGVYHCEIPDSINVTQTIYIGVYTGGTGELHFLLVRSCSVLFDYCYTAVLILQKSKIIYGIHGMVYL